jgi:hypothetical protein
MPTELKGASALRKALKQFSPDLDKETRDEMVGFLKPVVKKARGFLPSNSEAPSGFVKHEVKTAKFPMYDAAEARKAHSQAAARCKVVRCLRLTTRIKARLRSE